MASRGARVASMASRGARVASTPYGRRRAPYYPSRRNRSSRRRLPPARRASHVWAAAQRAAPRRPEPQPPRQQLGAHAFLSYTAKYQRCCGVSSAVYTSSSHVYVSELAAQAILQQKQAKASVSMPLEQSAGPHKAPHCSQSGAREAQTWPINPPPSPSQGTPASSPPRG